VGSATQMSAAAPPMGPPQLFVYPVDVVFTTGLANEQQKIDLLLDPDYDFLWDRINSVPNAFYAVFVEDATNGQILMGSRNQPVFLENIAGQGNLPAWLPKPMRIKKGTILSFTFTARVNGLVNLEFCLVGKKVPDVS
jgi:hypothetical protein